MKTEEWLATMSSPFSTDTGPWELLGVTKYAEYADALSPDMWVFLGGEWHPVQLHWLQLIQPYEPPAIREWRRENWKRGNYRGVTNY